MTGRLARRLWHSPTVTTWGSLAVRLGTVVLVLPVVLVRFSPAEVVLWQLFTTLYMLALMMDFGLAPTFARMLAFARGGARISDMADMRNVDTTLRAPHGPGAASCAAEVMSTLRWLYPRVALALLAVFAVLGTWALLVPTAQVANPNTAWLAWAIVVVTTATGLWGSAYGAALQGMDQVAVLRRWEVATGLGQLACSIVVLALGGGLFELVAAYYLWVPVAAVRNRMLLRRLHPELFTPPAVAQGDVLRVMWPATWRSGLGVLMSHGLIQLSGVVYTQMAPAAEAAAYLVALRVVMLISQFSQAPFYSKLPRLAELQAAAQQPAQLRLAQRGMRLAYWVFVAGVLAVAMLAEPALRAVGSQTPFVPPGVWALMSLAFFAERFGAMHLQLYSLTNHIVWHIANGITGLIMVAVALALHSRLGAYALPAAMLLAYAGFYCIYSAAHTRSAFQLKLLRFESSTSLPPAAALCTGLGLVYFMVTR